MKFKYIPACLLLLSQFIPAQNIDSLFSVFVNSRTAGAESAHEQFEDPGSIKCGFGIAAQIRLNYDNFTEEQKAVLGKILIRTSTDKYIDSPGGHFRIHYDTAGSNAPDFDMNNVTDTDLLWLAECADSVYQFEVGTLGYPAPPSDGIEGGDSRYDIYIQNITDYGYTQPDVSLGNGKYTSYMVIDNNFSHTATKGKSGARVTVAHEFHHGIQMGNYILRESDRFYYEITSTAMEEFMYDGINDYYNYMANYFNAPDMKSLSRFSSNSDGYDLAVWNIFLAKRFGYDVIKKSWELMSAHRAMEAIGLAIQDAGSSFKAELLRFGNWTYFTNSRTIDGEYFKDAKNYPLLRVSEKIDGLSGRSLSTLAASNTFLEYHFNNAGFTDTLVAIISNSDIEGSIPTSASRISAEFNISNGSMDNGHKISDQLDIFASVTSGNSSIFSESYIYNNIPVEYFARENVGFPYPQPFKYSGGTSLFLPADPGNTRQGELYVYNINMNLAYFGPVEISNSGHVGVTWDCINNKGGRLASGVYIYVVKSGDKITKGKFAVLND